MPDQIITECPACHARFRVTEGQLKLADGQVRCGACLQVFHALTEAHRLQHRQHRQEPVRFVPRAAVPAPSRPEATADTDSPGATDSAATAAAAPAIHQAASSPPANLDMIPELHAEPILLDISQEQEDPVATTGWLLTVLAALVALGLQYLWFERAQLASDPGLSPFYTLACEHLPCNLGAVELRFLVNEELIVRPHPRYDDALRVDFKLLNLAAFAQPFPALRLSFRDLRGRLVADRVLMPSEYLAHPIEGRAPFDPLRMPPGTPLELQLEITDPGPDAVSYELQLLPP